MKGKAGRLEVWGLSLPVGGVTFYALGSNHSELRSSLLASWASFLSFKKKTVLDIQNCDGDSN